MGMLATFVAIISILGIVASGSYEQAIVLPENEIDAKAIVFLCGTISILFSFIVTGIFILFGNQIINIFSLQNISKIWIYGIGFFILLVSFDAILSKFLIRRKHFRILATTAVAQQIGANGVKIGAGFFGLGVNGLLLATIFGYLIREIRLLFSQRDFLFCKDVKINIEKIKLIALRYKKFPLLFTGSSLLNSASVQVPVILFASLYSAEVAGYYSLGHRILSLPMILIGQSVANVFLERAARARENIEELGRITLDIYKRLLFVGAISMSFVTFYGSLIFPIIFGESWKEAGIYSQWISIWIVFQLSLSPISNIFTILERQGELFFWQLLLFLSRISILFFSLFIENEIIMIIALYAVTSAVVYFIFALRVLVIVKIKIISIFQCIVKYLISVYSIQFGIYFFARNILFPILK
jgi:O-antigen/teichoic acid export membrane protein